MIVNKSKLMGLMLAFLMTSGVYAYANNEKDGSVSPPDSLAMKEMSQKNLEIVKKVKDCIGVEDIRIIQAKSFDMVWAWTKAEAENEKRQITMRLNKEIGVHVAMSLPKSEKWEKMNEKAKNQKGER